jgi:hypothetical protein
VGRLPPQHTHSDTQLYFLLVEEEANAKAEAKEEEDEGKVKISSDLPK